METVIVLMMTLISLGFIIKLTFMRIPLMVLEVALISLAVIQTSDFAAEQSKTQIAEWLQTPDLMLDIAVLLTVDIALHIAFCFAMAGNQHNLREKILGNILLYIPGLLILPTAFLVATYMMFSLTGYDFDILGYILGGAMLIILPLFALGTKYLLPDRSSRLELIFYLNCIVGMLGIIATVNGRTTTAGTNELNLPALLTILVILVIGYVTGLILYNHKSLRERI